MKHFTLFVLAFLSSLSVIAKDVNVTTAGELKKLIPAEEKNKITELNVSGNLNGDDIALIREMAGSDIYGYPTSGKLQTLDMSKANIVKGGKSYKLGNYPTEDNIIGKGMFSKCNKLVSLILPNTVTKIGIEAFTGCTAMKSIKFPVALKEIGDAAFLGCGFTEITIPEGITRISNYLFYNCPQLQTVNISSTITVIGDEAFAGCPLTAINVANGNTTFAVIEGVLFSNDETELIFYPIGRQDATYTMPTSTKVIRSSAFKNAQFQNIVLNNGLQEIKERSFEGCSQLKTVNLPNSIVKVGSYAFNKCSQLETVTISEGLTELSENMFSLCEKLDNVVIPNNIKKIGTTSFSYCENLKNITLSNQLDTIGKLAFNECISLEKIEIPNSVKAIEDAAFRGCVKLSDIKIPATIEILSGQIFFNCISLQEMEIPNSVQYIMRNAFQNSGLKKVSIPESCKSITDAAFMNCKNLKEIFNYSPTPQPLGIKVFEGTPAGCILYVPKGAKEAYQNAEIWNSFEIREMQATGIDTVENGEQVTEVARYNIKGQRIYGPENGVNIIHLSNGKVKKVLVNNR